jgi:hypothetical protein
MLQKSKSVETKRISRSNYRYAHIWLQAHPLRSLFFAVVIFFASIVLRLDWLGQSSNKTRGGLAPWVFLPIAVYFLYCAIKGFLNKQPRD